MLRLRKPEYESNLQSCRRGALSDCAFPAWILLSIIFLNRIPTDRGPAADFSSAWDAAAASGNAGETAFSFPGSNPPAHAVSAGTAGEYYDYRTQSGDSLYTVAVRFGAYYSEIRSASGLHLPERGLLPPGTELIIPKKFKVTTDSTRLFPDSELVNSATSEKFSVDNFVLGKRGYLLGYKDIDGATGSDVIRKLARENSIHPKILLSLLEYRSGWVTGKDSSHANPDYPMHIPDPYNKGLYQQMMLVINYLERGYYGWRSAKILCLYFNNGESIRLAPDLNAGTVAVMFYFSKITSDPASWKQEIEKFFNLYREFFGDPRENALEPLYPEELYPPYLILPFSLRQSWCFSNGPHGAWDAKGPEAAVDFAPPQYENSGPLTRMVLASAPGCIVRSEGNAVVLDLDCDGSEQTGWNIFYYHLAEEGRARRNSKVSQGKKIGFASNEGGVSSGVHIHMARKYNGEWILADGPLPLVLSGWALAAGSGEGEWYFLRGGTAILASNDCDFPNMIWR